MFPRIVAGKRPAGVVAEVRGGDAAMTRIGSDKPTGRRLRRRIALLLLAAFLVDGCAYATREVTHPTPPLTVPPQPRHPEREGSATLKVHLRDGGLVVLRSWHVGRDTRATTPPVDTLIGEGQHFDAARHGVYVAAVRIPSDEVVLIETDRMEVDVGSVLGAVLLGVGIALGVTLVLVAIACAMNPKCFGSCPTFYVSDGEHLSLMAEGFSASIAPALEATDVDALWRARPRGRTVEIVMRNEAPETHVVRSVRLLVAPRGDGRVMQTMDGRYFRVTDPHPPRHALAEEGDVAARLAAIDGDERASLADSTDLGAHERIALDFGDAHGAGLGLAVCHRQSLVMTYLLYQTLAWMGAQAGDYLAQLERGDPKWLDMAQGAGKALGPIEVQVREPGADWRTVGTVDETGPIASDVHLVPLPVLTPGSEISLWLTRGHWRLDAATLVRIGARVEPVTLEPSLAVRDSLTGAPVDRATLGGRPLVTMPGQSVIYHFELPDAPERCELFLESRGYYLEWIRAPWLGQEDPAQLVSLMVDPRGALRRLAPAYKRQEAELERAFWGSRAGRP